jgi:hypothetical protein
MNNETRPTLTLTPQLEDQRCDRDVILETNRLVQKLALRGAKTLIELEHAMHLVNQPISALDLGSRTQSALTSAGVTSVKDLLLQTPPGLLQYESIGRKDRNVIIEMLALKGLRLADPSPPMSMQPVSEPVLRLQQNKAIVDHPIASIVRETVEPPPPSFSQAPLKKGDVVRHPTKSEWGIGRVQSVTIEGVATILFSEAGVKSISLKHIQLDLIRQTSDAPPILPTVVNLPEPPPGKVLCTNCGQPTVFTENTHPQRYAHRWCDACFKHSQRTFKDSVTGETKYFDEFRTIDGIKHRYYSPK